MAASRAPIVLLPLRKVLLILALVLLASNRCSVVAETEVNFIPNEQEDRASLPMSMKQRQQLLQLQQTISKSPDPQGTLKQVATSNQMDPQDLLRMLQTNAQDLEQDPGLLKQVMGGTGYAIPNAINRAVTSVAVLITGMAKKHPRSFGLVVATLIFLIYAAIEVPRTGLVLSARPKPFWMSSGPTTLAVPPTKYLKRLVESDSMNDRMVSSAVSKRLKVEWDDLESDYAEDQIIVTKHKLPRADDLKQAVSASIALPAAKLMNEFSEELDDDDDEQRDYILDLMYENAQSLISNLQWTEFVGEGGSYLRMFPSEDKDQAVLVSKGMGDWGRYGFTYWRYEESFESPDVSSLTLSSLKGTAMDAQIHVSISWEDDAEALILRVHLASPRGGRIVSSRAVERIVRTLTSSLSRSIVQRARQKLVRASQSGRVQQLAHRRALERRALRFETLRKLENMAEDRRRKWQRNNPSAGRYQPSGIRQQSPNNC